jgi:hypothetical protein
VYRTIAFRLPARRPALVAAAAALAAAVGALAVPEAQAAPAGPYGGGTSTAAVLRAGLDVSLLGSAVDVPVNASLDDVRAPAGARETALTVTVGHGVEAGRDVSLLRAKAATADATADERQARGYANLVDAQVHVPGLPLLALVRLDAITATATCRAGRHPSASATLVGVTVLGRRVALHAVGPTDIEVPGVGTVRLDLTRTATTSTTAAATALRLAVRLDPLSLGVAKVSGTVTLAEATCRTPRTDGSTGGTTGGTAGGSASGGTDSGATSGGSTSGQASGGATSGTTSGATSGGSTSGQSSGGSASGGASNGGSASGGTATGGTTSGTTGGSASGQSSGGTSDGGSTDGGPASGASGPAGPAGTAPRTLSDGALSGGDLAHTGASSVLPYLLPAAAGSVAAGAGVLVVTGRRRRAVTASRDGA